MISRAVVLAVEDELSAAVLRRLISVVRNDLTIDRIINTRGYGSLKAGMKKFKSASTVLPHVVLTDLDRYPCPPALLADWKATVLPPGCLLRVAVREVEAWLLADREGLAEFLNVALSKFPEYPEAEVDPKQKLVNIARKCRSKRLSVELVPAAGSSAPIGPGYNTRLSEFVVHAWNVERARNRAPSLDRAIARFASFPGSAGSP